jgi:16S rRNA (uracil1498-N3)-methyltransferase
MNRFFLSPQHWDVATPQLDADESHHATDVLRLEPGARLTIFDGKGREAMATISGIEGKAVQLKIGAASRQAHLAAEITLVQAVPKGKNMDLIVQKAVELGASRIIPVLSERTIVRLEPGEAARKAAKWQQVALEACKQCGQNRIPDIDPPGPLSAVFSRGGLPELMLVGSLQPDARPIKGLLAEFTADHGRLPKSAAVFIGPEGDFTPAELALAKSQGCLPVTLGPIILRTETAAIYCLSVLAHELLTSHVPGTC